LAITKALLKNESHRVVMAVRDEIRGAALARELGNRAMVRKLNLSSLDAIAHFVSETTEPIAGLVNNAGVQQVDRTHLSQDGLEETIAVNHLAAFALTQGLLPRLTGGRVMFIGSGTHNPENRTATRFGFRGAQFTSIEQLAKGESAATSAIQQGLDRYATSKWLNTVSAIEWTRRVDPRETLFFTFDPGLMAGTGLARTSPLVFQWVWGSVLRWASALMDDSSTPERSAASAVELLTQTNVAPGEVYAFNGRPSELVWPATRDPSFGARVFDETVSFLDSIRVVSGAWAKPSSRSMRAPTA
jgi:NAD(P)-dependent dehydrogenase (short-subunit alcohol dehydrogenase family)